MEGRLYAVRTSDRATFKRCRRKWGFSSANRRNLDARERPSYFWIGTGGHFALEDYHGYNYYGSPVTAFEAYIHANEEWARTSSYKLPADYKEQADLGCQILEYYLKWARNRPEHPTVWIDGQPMVELRLLVELPIEPPEGYEKVVYQATIDRLVDIEGQYWVTDYKFYKSFQEGTLDYDQQMTSYCWIAQAAFDVPIAGAILHEFKKTVPNEPRILTSGKLSTDKSQLTTHAMYKETIEAMFGSVQAAPKPYIDALNHFAYQENEHGDRFIRRTPTTRNPAQIESEGSRILMEVGEMINPNLPLYTNPTKDCVWDCAFSEVCMAMDRDEDWEFLLQDSTVSRDEEKEEWRMHLPSPQ